MAAPSPHRQSALVALDGVLALIAVILIVQMWLLSATLESYLRGRDGVVLPAAIVSGVLFLACLGLGFLAARVDRRARD